jgi:hypothetical protein
MEIYSKVRQIIQVFRNFSRRFQLRTSGNDSQSLAAGKTEINNAAD